MRALNAMLEALGFDPIPPSYAALALLSVPALWLGMTGACCLQGAVA